MHVFPISKPYAVRYEKQVGIATTGMLWWKRKYVEYSIVKSYRQDFHDDPSCGNGGGIDITKGFSEVIFSSEKKEEVDEVYSKLTQEGL